MTEQQWVCIKGGGSTTSTGTLNAGGSVTCACPGCRPKLNVMDVRRSDCWKRPKHEGGFVASVDEWQHRSANSWPVWAQRVWMRSWRPWCNFREWRLTGSAR